MPYFKDDKNEIYFYEENSAFLQEGLIPITEDELREIQAAKAAERAPEEIRMQRDALLEETDLIIIRCAEAGEPVPEAWKAYRQALRDVPEQAGFPEAVTWPEKPAALANLD